MNEENKLEIKPPSSTSVDIALFFKVVTLIHQNPHYAKEAMAQQLGLSVRTLRNHLNRFEHVLKVELVNYGSNRKPYWVFESFGIISTESIKAHVNDDV